MKLDELWRRQYRSSRYLEHLSREELRQRMKDIVCNMINLNEQGEIVLLPMDGEGEYWVRLWTHVLEESRLRYGQFPTGFTNGFMKDTLVPKATWPGMPNAFKVIKERNLKQGTYLVKYGKCKYLRPLFEEGLLKIKPASSYDDSSLNPAIKDSELELNIYSNPSKIKIRLLDKITKKPKKEIKPIGKVTHTFYSKTDYYVFCLSSVYDPRLFGDFESDACLIINQPKIF